MKYWKKFLCAVLCIPIAVQLAVAWTPDINSVRASELTNDTIKEKEEEIKAAQEQKKKMQSDLTDVKKIKEELETSKKDLSAYVVKLDSELTSIEEKIAEYKKLIEDKEEEIKQTQIELDDAVKNQETQYEAMKERIKFMYEKGDSLYMELIFSSSSFGEMLNKTEYIEMISSYDRKMLDQYVAARQYIELCKKEMEEEQSLLEDAKGKVEEKEADLNSLIDEKERTIKSVTENITNKEAAIAEYEQDIAEQNETIATLEKIVAAEKARLAEENGLKYDGGIFAWPAPSYTTVSSDYGTRMHPILMVEQFHNGVDLAAPGGSPILAAYDGNVVAADYSGSMGNYIMIDHGDGLYTIYMHASALYVSKGDFVTKGQKIAAVGSTGRSTGNHLHFTVRLNGNYVSPWKYISR